MTDFLAKPHLLDHLADIIHRYSESAEKVVSSESFEFSPELNKS